MPDVLERDMHTTAPWAGPPGQAYPEHRDSQRSPVSCKVFYTGLSGQGQGTTANLSKAGCLIEGDLCPKEGERVTLVLHRTTSPDLIVVDKARVVWTMGRRFGVAHETVYPSELTRLHGLLGTGDAA